MDEKKANWKQNDRHRALPTAPLPVRRARVACSAVNGASAAPPASAPFTFENLSIPRCYLKGIFVKNCLEGISLQCGMETETDKIL